MRRWFIGIVLAMLAGEGRAGVLHCSFTEPFFTISFDSRTGTVTQISADIFDESGKPIPRILAEGAKLRVLNPYGDGLTSRVETDRQFILQLRLTGRGSDGMSETMFPFEAKYGTNEGGCETEKYPAFDIYDILEDLGASR